MSGERTDPDNNAVVAAEAELPAGSGRPAELGQDATDAEASGLPVATPDTELRSAQKVVEQPAPAQEPELRWAPPAPVRRGWGGSALSFGIAALIGASLVGWLFPIGIVAVVFGILTVRRSTESTVLGWWAIALGTLSLIYSAGWLWYLGQRLGWWG